MLQKDSTRSMFEVHGDQLALGGTSNWPSVERPINWKRARVCSWTSLISQVDAQVLIIHELSASKDDR